MVEEEKSESDVFTQAFETLAKTGEVPEIPVEAKAEETPVVEEEKPVEGESDAEAVAEGEAEPPVNEGDAGTGEVQAAGDVDRPAETTPPKEPQKAADADIIDRLAQAVKDRVQPPVQEPQPTAYEPPPVLTQDDYKALEAFEKDWPDVAKAMDLRAKEQAHAIVNHIFKEFANEFRPVAQEVMAMKQALHVQQLQQKVEDYPVVREQVLEWAAKQPAYLRNAYAQVIQYGTPDDVADLIQRYKADTAPPPAPAPVAAPPAPKQLSPAVKKAAAALAPVQSKRSQVVQTDDPGDFEGAFQRFSGMM